MNVRRILLGLAAAAAMAWGTSSAQAYDGYGAYFGQAFGLMNAYGSSGTMYGLGRVPVPPYFSLHPPVYYGYRVARPYGYSPYAAPAGVLPAEFVQAPKLIDNPFYVDAGAATMPAQSEAAPAEEHADDTTSEPAAETTSLPGVTAKQPSQPAPQMIVNPYYVAPADAARIAAAR